jgi:hypothetical protein
VDKKENFVNPKNEPPRRKARKDSKAARKLNTNFRVADDGFIIHSMNSKYCFPSRPLRLRGSKPKHQVK